MRITKVSLRGILLYFKGLSVDAEAGDVFLGKVLLENALPQLRFPQKYLLQAVLIHYTQLNPGSLLFFFNLIS